MKKQKKTIKFRAPVKNTKNLRIRLDGTTRKVKTIKHFFTLPRKKYIKFFHKARMECPTAFPVNDIVLLLLDYYLHNEFIIHRRLVLVNDPRRPQETAKRVTKRFQEIKNEFVEKTRKIHYILNKKDANRLNAKMKRDGVSRNFALNLLVDYYLNDQFLVKTKIIRSAPYKPYRARFEK